MYALQDIDPDDEIALERFMNKNPEPSKKLGEILMEKLTEKRTEIETQLSDAGNFWKILFFFYGIYLCTTKSSFFF